MNDSSGPETMELGYRRMEPVKRLLTALGGLCGPKAIHYVSSSIRYMEVGQWIKSKNFWAAEIVGHRQELFQRAASRVADKNVLYLEFGVAHGRSMRYWSKLLKNPASNLNGFDTFEGLPQNWTADAPKGAYSQMGQAPIIDDPRVRFFKGLFQETLPNYIPPRYEALIINIDCDLYSSTSFVLNCVAPLILPGTLLYFDEFADRDHELRAFDDFMSASGKQFVMLAATNAYQQTLFECVGAGSTKSLSELPHSSASR